jgi:hypothetical protein
MQVTLAGAGEEVSRLTVDEEGVGDVGRCAGDHGLAKHGDGVPPPPLPENDGELLVRLGERVGEAPLGVDDERAVHGGAQPGAVRVPPQRPLLVLDREPVRVAPPPGGWGTASRTRGRPPTRSAAAGSRASAGSCCTGRG